MNFLMETELGTTWAPTIFSLITPGQLKGDRLTSGESQELHCGLRDLEKLTEAPVGHRIIDICAFTPVDHQARIS